MNFTKKEIILTVFSGVAVPVLGLLGRLFWEKFIKSKKEGDFNVNQSGSVVFGDQVGRDKNK